MFEQFLMLYLFFATFVTLFSLRMIWLLIFKNILFQESVNIYTKKVGLSEEFALFQFKRERKEIMQEGAALCGSLRKANFWLFGSLCILITLQNLFFWWRRPITKCRLFRDLIISNYTKF